MLTTEDGHEMYILWDEVYKLTSYKLDRTIFLSFDFEYGEYIEVNDKMHGWTELIECLDDYLQMNDTGWRQKLLGISPDDLTATLIFKRSNEESQR